MLLFSVFSDFVSVKGKISSKWSLKQTNRDPQRIVWKQTVLSDKKNKVVFCSYFSYFSFFSSLLFLQFCEHWKRNSKVKICFCCVLGYHDSKNGAQVPALQVGGHASSMAIAGWPRSAVLRSRKKEETAMCDARAMFIDDMLLCSSIGKAIIRDAENIWKPRAVQSGRYLFLVALNSS